MTAKELIAFLQTVPPDAEVWHEDGNFGGRGEEFDQYSIKFLNGDVLVRSPFWKEVD